MLNLEYFATLVDAHRPALSAPVKTFDVKSQTFQPWPDVSMMGVVNLSRDSWYRESVVVSVDAAVRRGMRLAAEGARIVDVGAESTLLNADRVDADEQNRRLVPVVEQLSDAGVLVSVETYQPSVTEACLEAGAAG